MCMVCGIKNGRYYTDLDAYVSKKVSVNAKCYLKEIMSPGCLHFFI